MIVLRCFSFHGKKHSTISRLRMLPNVSNLNTATPLRHSFTYSRITSNG